MLLSTALLISVLQLSGAPEIPATPADAEAAAPDGGVARREGPDGGDANPGFFARLIKGAERVGLDGGTAKTAAFDLADKLVSMHEAKEKEADAAAARALPAGTRGSTLGARALRLPTRSPGAQQLRGLDGSRPPPRTAEAASLSLRKLKSHAGAREKSTASLRMPAVRKADRPKPTAHAPGKHAASPTAKKLKLARKQDGAQSSER